MRESAKGVILFCNGGKLSKKSSKSFFHVHDEGLKNGETELDFVLLKLPLQFNVSSYFLLCMGSRVLLCFISERGLVLVANL